MRVAARPRRRRGAELELLELAARLLDLDRPVTPRGVLLVERLLATTSRARCTRASARAALHAALERGAAQALDGAAT